MAHAGTIEIKNLNKQYEVKGKPLKVLDNISLSIRPGEFISIVGSSGCGKSTLLRLLIGLEGGYDGQILLDGKPITGTSLDRGIVFQEHRLFLRFGFILRPKRLAPKHVGGPAKLDDVFRF